MGIAPIIAIIGGHSGTAWDLSVANYSGKSVSVAATGGEPTAIAFSSDGTKMYVTGDDVAATSAVYQYTLSTAWDVNTAVYASKSCVTGVEDTRPWGLAFSADGSKMYVLGLTNRTVYQYTLDPAWDVSTGAYASKSVSVNAETSSPTGIAFSADGSKMYVSNNQFIVYQYTLDPAWDVSTAVYASKSKSVTAQENFLTDVFFSSDGTKMYVVGYGNDTVYQYTLGTAWDVSTASYASKSKSVATQELNPHGLTFSADGYKMYVVGANNETVYQYTLYV